MATLNNFSPLPWYNHVEEQDSRKWWKYGNIYPLYCPSTEPIPFQFSRSGNKIGPRFGDDVYAPAVTNDGQYLSETGNVVIQQGIKSKVQVYRIGPDGIPSNIVLTLRCPEGYEYGGITGAAWALSNSSYTYTAYGSDSLIDLSPYPDARYLWVEVIDDRITERVWENGGDGIVVPDRFNLMSEDGTFIADIFEPHMIDGVNDVVNNQDILFSTIGAHFQEELPEGRYYIIAGDGENEWYSDIFTVVKDTTPFIRLEWWDSVNFRMDAGMIVYKDDDNNDAYKNWLLLRADIAKPTYDFEEDGETRDGYFYPTKQISKKTYAMHFLANEPLLDVLRLVRMSDYIQLIYSDNGISKTLLPTSFLVTPEWESEGDVAGVTVEFETDTIAKKLGIAYIRG